MNVLLTPRRVVILSSILLGVALLVARSEERRVGKECRL